MAKVPLTSAGIGELQTYLYSLTEPALLAEAEAVHADFVAWVDGHIELTTAQLDWLGGIDPLYIDYLAAKTAIAFRNRLPLELVVPSATGEGKWFLDKKPIAPRWKGPDNIVATGVLSFELGYTSKWGRLMMSAPLLVFLLLYSCTKERPADFQAQVPAYFP